MAENTPADWPCYVASTSYGNDSVALLQWALDRDLYGVTAVYMDTGWSAPWWTERVERCEEWARGHGIKTMRTASIGLEALVKEKKGWPRSGMQFCTQRLKIEPNNELLKRIDPCGTACCLVGVRREESFRRRNFPEYVSSEPGHGGRAVWAPLVDYTEAERNALLARAGFEPLPHRSMECFPCINAGKADIRLLDEPTISKIERIETEMGVTSKGKPRTMFRPAKKMGATGIRQIVQWANTSHGKFNLDDETGDDCDSGYCGL